MGWVRQTSRRDRTTPHRRRLVNLVRLRALVNLVRLRARGG